MKAVQLILTCLLSCALGDISEKLRQGQGFLPSAQSSDFQGLLAPFRDDTSTANVKDGPPIGSSNGGRTSGNNGGLARAGAINSANRVPIPFHNHKGDDDENNLDRLCNDAFHSFLCKPVGPRKIRIDGKLRPGAQLPPGVLAGSSSNVQPQQVPNESGGALLPTSLDADEDGYRYPKPSNNINTVTNLGYTYPKPDLPYNYEKPENHQAYQSQVSNAIRKPSNEYLPSYDSTTAPPFTFTLRSSTIPPTTTTTPSPPLNNFESFSSPGNQIPAQSNAQPVAINNVFYQYSKPHNQIQTPQASQNIISQPIPYHYPPTAISSSQTSHLAKTTSPAISFFTFTQSRPTYQLPDFPTTVFPQSAPVVYTSFTSPELVRLNEKIESKPSQPELPTLASNIEENEYYYPKPSNEDPVIIPTTLDARTASTASPDVMLNNGYLPPAEAPVPKETNSVYNSLPPIINQTPLFQSSFVTNSQQPPLFQPSTPVSLAPAQKFRTTFSSTTPRPFTYSTVGSPQTSVTSLPPFFFQTRQPPITAPPQLLPTSTPKQIPTFFSASSNDSPVSSPQKIRPSNEYLPPVNQPEPSAANDFQNILPPNQPPPVQNFQPSPQPPPFRTTPKPFTTLKPPSKEYLPQNEPKIEGSSTNLSPNIEGGSLLAAEGDAPSPSVQGIKTTEKTHTLEELCRDAFHSFLCKPIDKPRKRIDGRIREGAQIPPHVLIAAGSAAIPRQKIVPNQSGGALLPTELEPSKIQGYERYKPVGPAFQSTNLNIRVATNPRQQSHQQNLFIQSGSDSSVLAKQYSPNRKQSPSSSTIYQNLVTKQTPKPTYFVKTTPAISTRVASTTTPRPVYTTTTQRYTTTRSLRVSLQAAASANEQSLNSPDNPEKLGSNAQGSSTDNEGYNYPKPLKPFTFPTTAGGYNYPKPAKAFTFPSTQSPRSAQRSPAPFNQQFGQRLRPLKPSGQNQVQSQQQSGVQEAQFGTNEVFHTDSDLPPASQFEILKP